MAGPTGLTQLDQSLFPIIYTVRDLSPHSWRHIAFPGTQLAGLTKGFRHCIAFAIYIGLCFGQFSGKMYLRALVILDHMDSLTLHMG